MVINRGVIISLVVATASIVGCAVLGPSYTVPASHPEQLGKTAAAARCSDCHEQAKSEFPYKKFDHTPTFSDRHRVEASQFSQVCNMCHAQSFCNDCHVTRVELKPSIRRQSDTYRRLPHRGDYRTRHVIDARLDPTGCFRCHGSPRTAKTCTPCHGR